MKWLKRLFVLPVFILTFLFLGCRSEMPSVKSRSPVADVPRSNVTIMQGGIEVDWLEARSNEKRIIAFDKLLHKYRPANYLHIQSEAEKAKDAICSDSEYLEALRKFSAIASNRAVAIQAEVDVYKAASAPTM